MPVRIADTPLQAVVLGSGKCLEEFEVLQRVLVSRRTGGSGAWRRGIGTRSARLLVVGLVWLSLAIITVDYREGGLRAARRGGATPCSVLAPLQAAVTTRDPVGTSSQPRGAALAADENEALKGQVEELQTEQANADSSQRRLENLSDSSACGITPHPARPAGHRQRRVELRPDDHDRPGLRRWRRGRHGGRDREPGRRAWSAGWSRHLARRRRPAHHRPRVRRGRAARDHTGGRPPHGPRGQDLRMRHPAAGDRGQPTGTPE